jgi:hypothetical protein
MTELFKVYNLRSQIERGPFDSCGAALDYLRGVGRVGKVDPDIIDHVVLRQQGENEPYQVVLAGDQLVAAVVGRS